MPQMRRMLEVKRAFFVKTILLLGMMIPIHATLLPNYKIYNTLGLTDTIWALLIPYVAFSLPQGLFLMTGFIDSIPWEMEEAAVMDGCGINRIVFQIITPMLKPSIATVAIMTFLNNWNEFIMASTYLSTPKWKTSSVFRAGIHGTVFFQLCGTVRRHGAYGGTGSHCVYSAQ